MAQDIYSTNTNKNVSGQAKVSRPRNRHLCCLFASLPPCLLSTFASPVQSSPIQFGSVQCLPNIHSDAYKRMPYAFPKRLTCLLFLRYSK